jgi:protein-disulfide isomerase
MSSHQTGTLRPPVSDRDHVAGPADAAVTLVEYGDYQCPHCARAHPVITEARRRLGNQLRFVYRNFPLTEIHPEALHAAEAAESVADQAGGEAYWAMHDALFEHQQDSEDALDDLHLAEYAAAAGADPERVERDLESEAYSERVRTDFMSGVRSGVNGTPTFFINGVRYEGNWSDLTTFVDALEHAARAHAGA